jgi:hypothetical protein
MPPIPTTPKRKDSSALIIEGFVAVLVLIGGYFGYTLFFATDSASTTTVSNAQIGKNLSTFVRESKGVTLDFSILDSAYVKSLEDHTQIFTYSSRRGRLDPFLPYDSTRPIR